MKKNGKVNREKNVKKVFEAFPETIKG